MVNVSASAQIVIRTRERPRGPKFMLTNRPALLTIPFKFRRRRGKSGGTRGADRDGFIKPLRFRMPAFNFIRGRPGAGPAGSADFLGWMREQRLRGTMSCWFFWGAPKMQLLWVLGSLRYKIFHGCCYGNSFLLDIGFWNGTHRKPGERWHVFITFYYIG